MNFQYFEILNLWYLKFYLGYTADTRLHIICSAIIPKSSISFTLPMNYTTLANKNTMNRSWSVKSTFIIVLVYEIARKCIYNTCNTIEH